MCTPHRHNIVLDDIATFQQNRKKWADFLEIQGGVRSDYVSCSFMDASSALYMFQWAQSQAKLIIKSELEANCSLKLGHLRSLPWCFVAASSHLPFHHLHCQCTYIHLSLCLPANFVRQMQTFTNRWIMLLGNQRDWFSMGTQTWNRT